MRVLFLVHSHPDLQAGGTEIFARDLFRTLRRNDVSGLFLAGTAAHQRAPSPGTPFQAIGGAPDELLMWTGGFDPFAMSQTDLHGVGKPLADLLREQQPDLVHIHHLMTLGVETVSVVRRCAPNARIVMTLHDYYPMCVNDGQLVTTSGSLCHEARPDRCLKCFPDRSLTDFKLRQLHIGRALEQIDHFIAPSRFLRDQYVFWGLSPDRITVVPNGLPVVEPAPARRTKRRDRFAFFGHINKFKGATVALAASAILSKEGFPHKLSIHGGTEHQTEQTVNRFASSCDDAPDARFHGPYRRSEFGRLIGRADWVIFPSQWWENAPLVINEAFQHYRPVLCSDIGGAVELVQDGVNGLHFAMGDAADLAEMMRQAVDDRGLWQRLVDGISPPVTIEESARQHIALYERALSSSLQQAAA